MLSNGQTSTAAGAPTQVATTVRTTAVTTQATTAIVTQYRYYYFTVTWYVTSLHSLPLRITNISQGGTGTTTIPTMLSSSPQLSLPHELPRHPPSQFKLPPVLKLRLPSKPSLPPSRFRHHLLQLVLQPRPTSQSRALVLVTLPEPMELLLAV